jgi:hypothetical protein
MRLLIAPALLFVAACAASDPHAPSVSPQPAPAGARASTLDAAATRGVIDGGASDAESSSDATAIGDADDRSDAAVVAKIKEGDVLVSGIFSVNLVKSVVRASYGTLAACYRRGSVGKNGRVVVDFGFDTAGKATQPSIAVYRLRKMTSYQCITDVFRSLRAPASPLGSTTVEYEFFFDVPPGAEPDTP